MRLDGWRDGLCSTTSVLKGRYEHQAVIHVVFKQLNDRSQQHHVIRKAYCEGRRSEDENSMQGKRLTASDTPIKMALEVHDEPADNLIV